MAGLTMRWIPPDEETMDKATQTSKTKWSRASVARHMSRKRPSGSVNGRKRGKPKKEEEEEEEAEEEEQQVMDITSSEMAPVEPTDGQVNVLAKLENSTQDRKRTELLENLQDVHNRIETVLQGIGLHSKIPLSPSETDFILNSLNSPPDFNARKLRAMMCRQENMMSLIKQYTDGQSSRHKMIENLHEWFTNMEDLEDLTVSVETILKREEEYEAIATNVEDAISHAYASTARIREIGETLLNMAGFTDSGTTSPEGSHETKMMSKFAKNHLLPKTIMDETQMLVSPENFSAAVGEIRAVLDKSLRLFKTKDAKALLRSAIKQYKNIIGVVEKKFEDLQTTEEELVKARNEVDRLLKSNDRWKKLSEKNDSVSRETLVENKQLKKDLEQLIEANKNIHERHDSLIRSLGQMQIDSESDDSYDSEEETTKKSTQSSTKSGKSSKSSRSKVSKDSSSSKSLKSMQSVKQWASAPADIAEARENSESGSQQGQNDTASTCSAAKSQSRKKAKKQKKMQEMMMQFLMQGIDGSTTSQSAGTLQSTGEKTTSSTDKSSCEKSSSVDKTTGIDSSLEDEPRTSRKKKRDRPRSDKLKEKIADVITRKKAKMKKTIGVVEGVMGRRNKKKRRAAADQDGGSGEEEEDIEVKVEDADAEDNDEIQEAEVLEEGGAQEVEDIIERQDSNRGSAESVEVKAEVRKSRSATSAAEMVEATGEDIDSHTPEDSNLAIRRSKSLSAISSSKSLTKGIEEVLADVQPEDSEISMLSEKMETMEKKEIMRMVVARTVRIKDLKKWLAAQSRELDKCRLKPPANVAASNVSTTSNKSLSLTRMASQIISLKRERDKLTETLSERAILINRLKEKIKSLEEEVDSFTYSDPMSLTKEGMSENENRLRNTILKMTNDYNTETKRLKNFVKSEQARNEAITRKMESTQRDQTMQMYRQVMHMARAINRFRDQVASVLTREEMSGAATDIANIPSLPCDEQLANAHVLFHQVATNISEFLNTIQQKLARALLHRRITIKLRQSNQYNHLKQLEIETASLQKAQELAEEMTLKYKNTMLQLSSTEDLLKDTRKREGERYGDITRQYRNLMGQYVIVSRVREKEREEYQRVLKEKLQDLHKFAGDNDMMHHLLVNQQHIISGMQVKIQVRQREERKALRMPVADMVKNLAILKDAYDKKLIKQEFYETSRELLEEALAMVDMMMGHLFHRYMQLNHYRAAREILVLKIETKVMTVKKRLRLELMMNRIDTRLGEICLRAQNDLTLMRTRKQEILGELENTFCVLISEVGVMVIPPSIKMSDYDGSSMGDLLAPLSICSPRQQQLSQDDIGSAYSMLPPIDKDGKLGKLRLGRRAPTPLHQLSMPDAIVGSKLPPLQTPEGKYWSPPGTYPLPNGGDDVRVTVPRILHMDVTQHLHAARKSLAKVFTKQWYKAPEVAGYDYREEKVRPIHEAVVRSVVSGAEQNDSKDIAKLAAMSVM